MKYFYFKGFKIFGTFVLIFLVLSSCKKETNEGGASPGNLVSSPYENPVWHPSGDIIGFNYTPLSEIIFYPGGMRPIFKLDSAGFWLVNSYGTSQRRVLPYKLLNPQWSPDGKWIAASIGGQIFKIPFDGTNFNDDAKKMLTSAGGNFNPSWSPDGEWIAYDSNAESPNGMNFIWKMDKEGKNKKRLAYTPDEGEVREPNWGRNNTIVHFRYVRIQHPEIFTMDTAGNDVRRITNNNYTEVHPKYSPSGEIIGFITVDAFNGDRLQLHLIDKNGSNLRKLPTTGIYNFSWSPDGNIVYQSFDSEILDKTKGTLWIMDASGNNKKPLTYNVFKITK